MSRKFTVFFLPLALVILQAVSASAYFTSSDVEAFLSYGTDASSADIDIAATEGYNYFNRVYVDAWPEGETPRPVSWEIYPEYDWLDFTIGGNMSNDVYLRGILPPAGSYILHVIAHLDCLVPASHDEDGNPLYDDGGNVPAVEGHIAADVDLSYSAGTGGLVFEVDPDETAKGLFPDMVSIDASGADDDIYTVSEGYNVVIDFPMSWTVDDDPFSESETPPKISIDCYPNAMLDSNDTSGINLPQWLGYEVTAVQYGKTLSQDAYAYEDDTSSAYVKTLRIFFTNRDYMPKDGEKAVVRILTLPSELFSDIYSNDATIAWDVTFRAIPAISLDKSAASLDILRGGSGSVTFTYANAAVSGDPSFSPAVNGVTFTASVTPADESGGTVTVTAAATSAAADGSYPVTMTVTDVNGKTAESAIILAVSTKPGSIDITVSGGETPGGTFTADGDAKTFTLTVGNSLGGVSWTITGNGASMISPTSGTGNTVRFTIDPSKASAGSYTATLNANDDSGRDAGTYTFTWTVEDPPISLSYASGDRAAVYVGGSADITINYSVQTPADDGISFVPDISADVKLSAEVTHSGGNSGTITVTAEPLTVAAKLYSTDITVTDTNGNTAGITVYISVDIPAISLGADRVSLTRSSAAKTVSWSGARPKSWTASPAIASSFNFSFSSDDEAVTLSVNPDVSFTQSYTGTITVTDIYGSESNLALTLSAAYPASLAVTASESSVRILAGESSDISLTASGNAGLVSWECNVSGAGITAAPTAIPHATQYHTTALYTVTGVTPGSYTATFTATDSAGRMASANVAVNVDVPGAFSVSPSRLFATVTRGGSAVSAGTFTAGGSYGAVRWTAGALPSGVTVSPETHTGTTASYTVTASTAASAGTHRVTVTAADSSGRTAAAEIIITVNSPSQSQETSQGTEEQTSETEALIESYKSAGSLKQDGTIPDEAVTFTQTDPGAQTLSRTGTNQISRGSSINPISIELDFPVDIWRVYINDTLAAWAYSPGVSGAGADDSAVFFPAEGSRGIDISAQSKTKAEITFDTSAMPSGSNEIAAAFVPDATKPDQEIGRSSLATVNISADSSASTDSPEEVGSSSGGCETGFGAVMSALSAVFLVSRKRS